jgi:predicted AlkP superfamily phosphohydrolase/phosphomutase
MKESSKIMIIGIDGATFKVVDYLIGQGRLPNLKRMLKEGVRAPLISTIQPLSHTAWVSFYTGKNPGKHGISDVVRRRESSYGFQPVSGSSVLHEPLWSVFSRHGKRVCVYNVPMSYPPRPVNGIMISGMDTPSTESPFTYPASLKEEILKKFPHYTIDVPLDAFVSTHHPQPIKNRIKESHENLTLQVEIIDYLLSKEEWDLFIGIITVTDRLQHLLWKYAEKKINGEEMTEDEELYAEGILGAYVHVDKAIGHFVERYGAGRKIMIMSDHGFGLLVKDVHLNNFLAEHGFLSYHPFSFQKRAEAYFRKTARRNLPLWFKKFIKGTVINVSPWFDIPAQRIDWKKTKVYSVGSFGNLYINLKGREPMGIVEPGSHYESVREEVISRLYELKDPEDGRPVIDRVYKREEVYHGDALDLLPDIFIVMRNYSYLALNQFEEIQPSKGVFGKPLKAIGELSHTGSHRLEGILMMQGENILKGKEGEASMLDIAPTILCTSELPILEDYDGKILLDFFEPSWWEKRDIHYELHPYRPEEEVDFSKGEERLVKERLQGLGYL